MREGNQFIRIPIGAKKKTSPGIWVQVTQVPPEGSEGRKKYTGQAISPSAAGGTLIGTPGGADLEFYNVDESTGTGSTPFLVIGDVVRIEKYRGIYLCGSDPRGYL